MKKLVLVDGNALLHRAYHATPPLTTSKGLLVNAVYGFTSIFLRSLADLKPDYVAVAWDKKAPTFRHAQYVDYKANRQKADDALMGQYDTVDLVLKSLDVPQFGLPGFEADDLIGALARQAEKKEIETVILTGDRDIMQLISPKIKVLMPKKTINDVGMYGEEEFGLRYGFLPINMIDYKSLAGDASDNIPGVPGIGEVTATKLIQEYGTLEKVYENIDILPTRTQELLAKGKESALMSKKLATIECDIPIKLDLEKSKIHGFDMDEAIKVFQELEFKSLINRIPGITSVIASEAKQSKSEIVASPVAPRNVNLQADSEGGKNERTAKLDEEVDVVLKKMTETGVLIDLQFLNKLGEDLKSKLAIIEREIYSDVGHEFNLNSPKQLSGVLFDDLLLPVIRKTKTGRSTDEGTLRELSSAHPVVSKLLEYRQLFKLVSTYVDALPKHIKEDGRIHSTFNVEGAITGRLSSQNPNLQNIPVKGEMGGELRKAFIVPKGKVLLGADYSQIELRIMAHLSSDENLIKAFKDGLDIHATTASKIFNIPISDITKEQRNIGKTMNFATLYGQGAHALAQQLGVDYQTARNYIDEYFLEFPKIKIWKEKILAEATETGFAETLWGRRRYFPELKAGNQMMRSFGERAAVNMPIQGSSADMIKKAMVEIDKELSVVSRQSSDKKSLKADRPKAATESCRLILQIHDELLFECDPDSVKEVAKMVKEKMENALKLDIPVIVDLKVGKNWGEMEKLNVE
jgi:DNA polymerase-1